MLARPLLLAALLAPTPALAEGGGGVTLQSQFLPRYGRRDLPHEAPGLVGCIGGVGYGVNRKSLRIGGEGVWCKGARDEVNLLYGGAQLGVWRGRGNFYWSAYAGFGFGSLTDGTVDSDQPYRSLFTYLKPTVAVGFAFPVIAVELGFFGLVPFNWAQWVGPYDGRGFVTPQVGIGVDVLFGDLVKEKKKQQHRCDGRCDHPMPNHAGPAYPPPPQGAVPPQPYGPPPPPPPIVQGEPPAPPEALPEPMTESEIADPEGALPLAVPAEP